MAEEPRRLLREAVIAALWEMSRTRGAELVAELAAWMDGFLPAAVWFSRRLRAVRGWTASPRRTKCLPDSRRLSLWWRARPARINGPRAIARVRTLAETMALFMRRFPKAAGERLEARALSTIPNFRTALEVQSKRAVGRGKRVGGSRGSKRTSRRVPLRGAIPEPTSGPRASVAASATELGAGPGEHVT